MLLTLLTKDRFLKTKAVKRDVNGKDTERIRKGG